MPAHEGGNGSRENLLLRISEHILLATDAPALMEQIASSLAGHLQASRCFLAKVDAAQDRFIVERDHHELGQPSIVGTHSMSGLGPRVVSKVLAGETVVVKNVATDPLTSGYEQNYGHFGIAACIVAPFQRGGRVDAALAITTSSARDWSEAELALLSTVVERTWLALEKLRLDRELRDREAQFRTMAGLMPVFIFTAGVEGEPEFVNEPFFAYTGLSARHVPPPVWSGLLHPEDREVSTASWRRAVLDGTVFQEDFRIRAADGTYRWFHGTAHPVSNGNGAVARWIGTCSDIDDLMRARTALASANERLEERVAERTAQLVAASSRLEREFEERRRFESELTELGEREREILGRDLHDGVCQHLTGVAMMADSLGESCQRKLLPEEARRLREIATLIRKASLHAWTVARSLHPVDVDAKVLPRALAELATHHSAVAGVRCRFVYEPPVPLHENEAAMHLFRIAQEAAQGAIRHAQARDVTLRLASEGGAVMLSVTHDGRGEPEHAQAAGLGLRVIRCHADALRATLTFDSIPGGTMVKCTLPPLPPSRISSIASTTTNPHTHGEGCSPANREEEEPGRPTGFRQAKAARPDRR